MKTKKYITLGLLSGILLSTISPTALAAESVIQNNYETSLKSQTVLTISNEEFQQALDKVYKKQQISTKDYNTISAMLNSRWGIKGKTKLVSNYDGSYDLYLNNILSAAVVGGTIAAITTALLAIPPVAAFIAGLGVSSSVFAGALGAATGAYTSADNGLIFHIIKGFGTNPFIITSVKEQ